LIRCVAMQRWTMPSALPMIAWPLANRKRNEHVSSPSKGATAIPNVALLQQPTRARDARPA
jgi:hypothetical protein